MEPSLKIDEESITEIKLDPNSIDFRQSSEKLLETSLTTIKEEGFNETKQSAAINDMYL